MSEHGAPAPYPITKEGIRGETHTPAEDNAQTRLMERCNLSEPHAALPTSRPVGTCPHTPAEGAPQWRGCGNCYFHSRRRQSACQRANALPFSIPDWWNGAICQSCTRRCRPVCQPAHALSYSARRTAFLPALSHY